MIKEFVLKLAAEVELGLPGIEAHKIMAPVSRPLVSFLESDYPQAVKAAVLLLFYPVNEVIYFVLIKRPGYDGVHGGQVSFPGGKMDKTDVDSAGTALRECEEETGIPKNDVRIFHKLSNVYIPPSNYFVFPYMGFMENRPEFIPDTREVEYIIEAPLHFLTEPGNKGKVNIKRNGENFDAPCYLIGKEKVWGATAIILSELEILLKRGNIINDLS